MSELAVRWRDDATPEAIAALEARLQLVAVRRIAALRVSAYEERPGLADALREEPIVEYVEAAGTMSVR